jgi:hypothetical protein
MTEEKHACCKNVCAPGTYGAFHQHRCRIKATAFRNGNWYCSKHDPEVAKVLSKKRDEMWAEKSRIEQAKFAAQVCIPDLLKAVKLVLALDGQDEVYPSGTYNLNDIPLSWVVRLDPKAKEQLQNAVKKYEDMIKVQF